TGPGAPAPAKAPARPALPGSSRKSPLAARLRVNRRLSGAGSGKDIRHFEFDLTGSGLAYEAGDALGVIPVNDPALVQLLLDRIGARADVAVPGHDQPLGELLLRQFEICTPSKDLIQAIGQDTANEELRHVLRHDDKESLEAWLWGKDVLDLLQLDPGRAVGAEQLLKWLRPLQHRAYSISSSGRMHPERVHLTVAAVRYTQAGRARGGVCSTYMADRVGADDRPQVFFSPNKSFRVPASGDAPMIMVGPGTGIAPFRAFLQEREATGAKGRNWLFFGDQRRAEDFIYEEELSAWLASGTLGRLDLAFSRDQKEKVYVQTRMRENGHELYAWLEEGGHFYVCGDASRMAKDVDDALHALIAEHAGITPERAVEYVNALKKDKRYVRDVY
ncbi:MAG: sulfite reductase subunit alpha, partial [Xenophilus sp.]